MEDYNERSFRLITADAVLAIEAEARAESAAKVRALTEAARAALTDLEWAYGREGWVRVEPTIDALLAALDADAPAEARMTEPPAEFYHGHDSYYEGCDECAIAYAYVRPEPRSAEPEGLRLTVEADGSISEIAGGPLEEPLSTGPTIATRLDAAGLVAHLDAANVAVTAGDTGSAHAAIDIVRRALAARLRGGQE